MCRNTILRFVLWYMYLYTTVIVLANVRGFFKIILLTFIFVEENVEKECTVV